MLSLALDATLLMLAAAIALAAVRLVLGPSPPDRILALDVLYVDTVAIAVLLGIRYNSFAYFEAALLIALMGFVSTVALARYAARGDVLH
jgi:multicomponent K+:H+ antiporter subunit F